MATLRRRLKDNFEYSAPVNHAYIRAVAGKSVTQWRSKLIASIKAGGSCPAGFDADVWRHLKRVCEDPHREELSQRMKNANACRVNKGRTGPKGEEGILEELYCRLGREPDPEELEYEMQRKKGYVGVQKGRKEGPSQILPGSLEEGSGGLQRERLFREHSPGSSSGVVEKRDGVAGSSASKPLDMNSIRRMEICLEQLQEALKEARRAVVVEGIDVVETSSLLPAAVETERNAEVEANVSRVNVVELTHVVEDVVMYPGLRSHWCAFILSWF